MVLHGGVVPMWTTPEAADSDKELSLCELVWTDGVSIVCNKPRRLLFKDYTELARFVLTSGLREPAPHAVGVYYSKDADKEILTRAVSDMSFLNIPDDWYERNK
jgi:hypothetical protein